MPTEIQSSTKGLQIRGKIQITSGDNSFSVDFQDERALVDFPSFSRLLRLKTEVDSLRKSISRLPPPPGARPPVDNELRPRTPFYLPEFRLTVRGRSVGKLDFQGGGMRFHLTPFDFITKRMS